MKILLTNNLDNWLQSCAKTNLRQTLLPAQIDINHSSVLQSQLLLDYRLRAGTAAALQEYSLKRKDPVIVTVSQAKLACVSLPTANNELEEHYYFVNNQGEWLTENPYLSASQYWFGGAMPSGDNSKDFYATLQLPARTIEISDSNASGAVFLGGRMNWTHWNIDFLPGLLMINPEKCRTLLTSKLNAWQNDSLDFFGFSDHDKLQISLGAGITIYCMPELTFTWNFDQIDRAHFLRKQINSKRSQLCLYTDLKLLAPDFRHADRVQRVANPIDLFKVIERAKGVLCIPSKLSYQEKLKLYSRGQTIITLPGSDSINSFLFSASASKIIQFIIWPNNLLLPLSHYSILISYRQLAYQAHCCNIMPFFNEELPSSSNMCFDISQKYSAKKLEALLDLHCL